MSELDWDQLKRCFDWGLANSDSPSVGPKGPLVLSHTLEGPPTPVPSDFPDGIAELKPVIKIDHGKALVGLPPALVPPPAPKRRKIGISKAATMPTLCTFDLDDDELVDLSLTLQAARIPVPLVSVTGPTLTAESAGGSCRLSLIFSVRFLPNAGPYARAQLRSRSNVALALFSKLQGNPALLNPKEWTTVSAADLFEALTKTTVLPAASVSPSGLSVTLLPFQQDSVRWCLRREGKDVSDDGSVIDLDPEVRDMIVTPPLGWSEVSTSDGNFWVNPYSLCICQQEPAREPTIEDGIYAGRGLLAEEMGLGKTIEVTSLILMNPRPDTVAPTLSESPYGFQITPIKATLIITPTAILSQWQTELETHAPELKVATYTGKAKSKLTANRLAELDVVLVSYYTIAREIHSATFNPARFNTRYWQEREDIDVFQSPLVQVRFWRVVLDEVQMVSTGVSNAAKVARLIPRVHSWGVTGTPVKTSMNDLRGILYFLDIVPFIEEDNWLRLLASPSEFERVLSTVGIRHTKAMVAKQLALPPQKRNLVSLDLSALERHRYDGLYDTFLNSSSDERELQEWLVKLRQTCCYTESIPTVTSDVILTLDQVLAIVVDDATGELENASRSYMAKQLELGQYLDKDQKLEEAIDVWKQVTAELDNVVKGLEEKIAASTKEVAELETQKSHLHEKLQALQLKLLPATDDTLSSGQNPQNVDLNDKQPVEKAQVVDSALKTEPASKEKSRENDEPMAELYKAESEFIDLEVALSTASSRGKSLKSRFRSAQELQHRAYFFIGTGYFRLTERTNPDDATKDLNSEQERQYYDKAEHLRTELLTETEEKVRQAQDKLGNPHLCDVKISEFLPQGKYLNKQAKLIDELRSQLVNILLMPLMDQDMDEKAADKTEAYAESLDLQESGYVLLDLIQLLLKDRIATINGGVFPANPREGQEPWSEFRKTLVERRNALKTEMSMNRIEPFVSAVHASAETDYAKEMNSTLRQLRKEIKAWQKEQAVLSELFNARIEYYKQLQILSDRVADPDVPKGSLPRILQQKRDGIVATGRQIDNLKRKLRYVERIQLSDPTVKPDANKPEDTVAAQPHDDEEEVNFCSICHGDISIGALTICGHRYCTECLHQWVNVAHTCPLCKTKLDRKDIFTYRFGGQETSTNSVQSHIDNELFGQISNTMSNDLVNVPLTRSYGVKIDTITRAARLLRDRNPDVQIVIFSQWSKLLEILNTALKANGLLTATINSGVSQFCRDTRISCFLLNAKSNAAGLTLINATHVFLCEPILNTALELQAISRIHRIGQMHTTHVWLFAMNDTVEQEVLAIATEKRVRKVAELQEKLGTPTANGDVADSDIMASSSNLTDRSTGSEVVLRADMRRILFRGRETPVKTEQDIASQV